MPGAWGRLNIAVFAPMATASTTTEVTVKLELLRRVRAAYRMSCAIVSKSALLGFNVATRGVGTPARFTETN